MKDEDVDLVKTFGKYAQGFSKYGQDKDTDTLEYLEYLIMLIADGNEEDYASLMIVYELAQNEPLTDEEKLLGLGFTVKFKSYASLESLDSASRSQT